MRATIYLPYNDYNGYNFDIGNDYYSNGGYEKALQDNFLNEKNPNVSSLSRNEEKTNYTTCECELFNEYMSEESVDSLITYAVSSDVNVIVVKFDFNTFEEEFETELKLWIQTHNKINGNIHLSDDEKFQNEPKRTFKICFKNLKNEDTYLEFCDCKLLEPIGNDGYAMLIERINFCKL